MKWSSILRGIAALTGIFGVITIFGAWIAGTSGAFLSFSQEYIYNNATVLLLASIAFGIGTLIHTSEEQQQ